MADWRKSRPGEAVGVKLTKTGCLSMPKHLHEKELDASEYVAVFHNDTEIGLQPVSNGEEAFSVKDSSKNRVSVRCRSTTKLVSELPEKAIQVPHEVRDTQIGEMLLIDLSEVND